MTAQTILPANSAASGGFNVTNSAMFDRASTTKMAKTFGTVSTAAQRRKLTLSMWVKPSNVSDNQWLFCHDTGNSSSDFTLKFEGQALRFYDYPGADQMKKKTSRLFRDVSAWYHVMLIIDTTLGTAADRVQIYVNGVRETSFSESTNPDQNDSFFAFSDADRPTTIGARGSDNSDYLSGYLAEYHCIVGTAKAHTDFGEFDEDTGIWKPIAYTGGDYSSNGFYLDFADSGDLGDDESGNENDFTETNFAATHQTTDTCTNNFATLNLLVPSQGGHTPGSATYTEGATLFTTANASSSYSRAYSTFLLSAGKWYTEIKYVNSGTIYGLVGITGSNPTAVTAYLGVYAYDYGWYGNGGFSSGDGNFYNNNGIVRELGSGFDNNDIVGMAIDLDNNTIQYYRAGSAVGSANAIAAPSATDFGGYVVCASEWSNSSNAVFNFNFGNPPYANSSSVTDGEGFGNFEYAPPSGFLAICSKNLAEYG